MTGGYEQGPLLFVGYYCRVVGDGGSPVRNEILKFFPDYTVTSLSVPVNGTDNFLPKLSALVPSAKGVRSGSWSLIGNEVRFSFRKLFKSEQFEGLLNGEILEVLPAGADPAETKPLVYRYHNKFDIEHGLLHE